MNLRLCNQMPTHWRQNRRHGRLCCQCVEGLRTPTYLSMPNWVLNSDVIHSAVMTYRERSKTNHQLDVCSNHTDYLNRNTHLRRSAVNSATNTANGDTLYRYFSF